MQRDIGNELIVAIIAVGILAFALTFGIILSLSNQNNGTEINSLPLTIQPTDDASSSATNELIETSTDESMATPTDVPTATDTAEPTATDTVEPTATNTDEPTDEPSATQTKDAVPTKTLVEIAAVESDTVEPSATLTDKPTSTIEPSATGTPTDEPTATNTAAPSRTPADKPTLTATRTSTATATPTLTATIRPSATTTFTPSNTPTLTQSRTPVPTADVSVCIAPFGWSPYIVQPGDTFSSIATNFGSNLADLRAGNKCLEGNRVSVGDILFVPLPSQIGTPDTSLVVLGCTDPGVQITSPLPGQQMGALFVLNGTASTETFLYYRVELRPDFDTRYDVYAVNDRVVEDGPLAQINTDDFSSGLHWIRLSVVDVNDRVSATPCVLPVYFG